MTSDESRRLVVLRHAKSAWPEMPDSERPLAPRGRREAPEAGRWLREADCVPDLVVCSPARRTRQTWDLIAAESVAGVAMGLVIGKVLGIFLGTYLAARFTKAQLNPDLAWADVLGLSVLAGIDFTVALLIGELAFPGQEVGEHVKAAVLIASLTAAVVAAVLLRRRNATYRRLWEAENIDADADGIPDIYQREADAPTYERN